MFAILLLCISMACTGPSPANTALEVYGRVDIGMSQKEATDQIDPTYFRIHKLVYCNDITFYPSYNINCSLDDDASYFLWIFLTSSYGDDATIIQFNNNQSGVPEDNKVIAVERVDYWNARSSTPCRSTNTGNSGGAKYIKEWSGSGIKTTETFTITKQPWQIHWTHNPIIMGGQSVGIFQIYVYSAYTDELIALAANSLQADYDTSYVHKSGRFYLLINAANTNWNVKIK